MTDPRYDLVNLLARRALVVEPCMRCGATVWLSDAAYIQLHRLYNRGCCVIFHCQSCFEEHERTHRAALPRESPKVLPLP